jgi:hypothetical protein
MNWTPLNFGKHEGKTLPQVMFEDADWFFNGYKGGYFNNGYRYQAHAIYSRSRSIRVPQVAGKRMLAEYMIHKPNGKFGTFRLIEDGPGLQHLYTMPVIDFYIPKSLANYDKLGYENFIFALKGILLNDHSRYMSKKACEEFFNDDGNFDLAYAAKKYPSPYGSLLVF